MPRVALPSTWRLKSPGGRDLSRGIPGVGFADALYFLAGKHLAARGAPLTAAAIAVPDPSLPGREPHPGPPQKASALPVI